MPNPDANPPASRLSPLASRLSPFLLSVISPSGTLFSGPVDSVVIPAWDGLMGILPGHAPLLALLRPGAVNARAGDKTHAFLLTGGFADVGPTHVNLIADSATQA
jgi:F-type H+-transporting ATPase subunit epsilon